MPITLDGMSRPKSVTTNSLSTAIAAGTPTEVDTGQEESIFVPFNLGATDPASFTVASVTTTSGQPTITVTGGAFANVRVGDVLSGTGIPGGTTVSSKTANNNSITMSANATASGTITLTVDPPSGTPTVFAIKVTFAKANSSIALVPQLFVYDGSLGSVTAASPTNAARTIDLVDRAGGSFSIDLDSFLTNFRVARSA